MSSRNPINRRHVRLEAHTMIWQVINAAGQVTREADVPIHNLVLTNGKNLAAVHGFSELNRYAVIGTGSTEPTIADVGLDAETARSGSIPPSGEQDSTVRYAPGIYDVRRVRQFTAAQAAQKVLTEWGWSPMSTAGGNLMCRELFRDGGGNAVPITLAAGDQLRLIYVTRITLTPVSAVPGTINIAGIGVRNKNDILYGDASIYSSIWPQIDLRVANAFARGNSGVPTNDQVAVWLRPSRPALEYGHNTGQQSQGAAFGLTFPPYVADSFTRETNPLVLGVDDAVMTFAAYGLATTFVSNRGYGFASVLDVGNEITKDNLHRLTFAPWTLDWS